MSEPVIIGNATLYQGDCLDVLRALPEASVHAVVTDPPYALSFMGKHWDKGFPDPLIWSECLRVLKPGGHMLAFGGTRTHHRLWCQIEDAGFYITDNIAWVYGSGFPKGKAQLKPAHEPICLAVKKGERWLNVDGCRVECDNGIDRTRNRSSYDTGGSNRTGETSHQGRWPANLIHDGSTDAVAIFDGTDKLARPGNRYKGHDDFEPACGNVYSGGWKSRTRSMAESHFDDTGSAARFFYCAKASKADRNEGLDAFEPRKTSLKYQGGDGFAGRTQVDGQWVNTDKANRRDPRNHHPTVKPTALMAYLCRLVTPPGGTVLDPFTGSGSTGKAAMLEGFRFIGIEREPEYFAIAQARIENAQRQGQLGLEVAA